MSSITRSKLIVGVVGLILFVFMFIGIASWIISDLKTNEVLDKASYPAKVRDIVYIEVSIDDIPQGRIDIGLFNDVVPITTKNFRDLLIGERGNGQTIVGTVFHRIITNFVIQGGSLYDTMVKTGEISKEEYESFQFPDEPNGLALEHSTRYLVQMANRGPDTNNSQFCFMLKPSPHLNGKHVVFGRVVNGFEIVDNIEKLASSKSGEPQAVVRITAGGEY